MTKLIEKRLATDKAFLRKDFRIPTDHSPQVSTTDSWMKAHRRTCTEVKSIGALQPAGFIWHKR
ncbi:MAG: hypothetical protein AABZ44_03110 [Elusimicrobiota bacterium]